MTYTANRFYCDADSKFYSETFQEMMASAKTP
jgi:hypothetical protein